MTSLRRIGLFLLVNLLVVITISVIMNVLGVRPYLTQYGLDYQALIIFCLIWGMGGAFISLALSRVMAKWMMGVKVISPETRDPELQDLVQSVHELARSAQLPAMPEVGVYDSPEVNAFATGPTKSRSLVAVSSGLLQSMTKEERRGVLGHEVAHIANGDFDKIDPSAQPAIQTLKISSRPGGIMKLFSTHPPLEERIATLKRAA